MTEIITRAQQFETPSEALAHYGVKGMQWGVRKDDRLEGVSRKTNKEAADDAREFARAKMFYGEGAGTRRKLIKAKIESKAKDPAYRKAFDHHLNKQDLGKHADKAKGERRRKDVTKGTTKTVKGAHRQLTGGFGNVTLGAAVLATGVVIAKQNNIDTIMRDAATTRYQDARRSRSSRRATRSAADDILRNWQQNNR